MEDNKDRVLYIPVEDILPNRFQPRLAFNEKELNDLANSIIKYGVIQPIVVRKIGEKYEIIAGERRYKASCLAGLKKIPAIMNNTDDDTSAEIALLENLQRKNLTVIEEAQSYKKLMNRGFTQDDIAQKLGVSQSSVANRIRLLNLPKEVQDALLYNKISERHARTLLSLSDKDLQINLLNRIINEKLTVKQTEDEVSIILNKDSNHFDIPKDIESFLNPQGNKPTEEIKIDVPQVIDIDEPKKSEPEQEKSELVEYKDDREIINPFQSTSTPNIIENIKQEKPVFEMYEEPKEETKLEESIETIELTPSQSTNQFEVKEIEEEKPVFEKKEEPIIEENDSLISEDGEVNLPKVIGRVRKFVSSLDEVSRLIETSEMDLDDKYQIIIEIDKNA
jgi:ParB family transcriptional regulator, chromosome partitioning protein